MKPLRNGLLVLLLVLFTGACSLDDDGVNYHFTTLPVVAVDMPESFRLNETYEIGVTVMEPNGCTQFEGFDVISEDTTVRRVFAIGTQLDDAVCTEAVSEVETSFQFICLYPGTYRFRFWTGEDEAGNPRYMEVEVPVTQ